MPASADLFEYSFQMIDILEKEGKSVACLFLSYGKFIYFTLCS